MTIFIFIIMFHISRHTNLEWTLSHWLYYRTKRKKKRNEPWMSLRSIDFTRLYLHSLNFGRTWEWVVSLTFFWLQTTLIEGLPRRKSGWSITSSWIKEALWIISEIIATCRCESKRPLKPIEHPSFNPLLPRCFDLRVEFLLVTINKFLIEFQEELDPERIKYISRSH